MIINLKNAIKKAIDYLDIKKSNRLFFTIIITSNNFCLIVIVTFVPIFILFFHLMTLLMAFYELMTF